MNKSDLVKELAEHYDTKKEAQAALDNVLNTFTKILKNGKDISLIGFGHFKIINRKSRVGVNPATKEKIKIPAKKVVKFVPGKTVKEAVN